MRVVSCVLWGIVVVATTLTGCGGDEFSSEATGGSGGAAGGGGTWTTGGGGGAAGAGTGGTSSGGSAGSGGTQGCDTPNASTNTVYVDKSFQGATRTGSQACPLSTIAEAVAVPHSVARIIHVVGATGGVTYDESVPVAVEKGVTLEGDGPGKVTIQASGDCGGQPCAVHVLSGGKVQGVSVTCPSGTGIVTAKEITATETPVVKGVMASNSSANGITTQGSAELGPIVANQNGAQGIDAQVGTVHVLAGSNLFNNNGANGINVSNGAVLVLEGGTASHNAFNGVRFDQSETLTTTQQISNLAAADNNNGVAVYNGRVKLRGCQLTQNKAHGLAFTYTATSALDIGTASSAGSNTFGGVSATSQNAKSGIFLCGAPGAGQQAAEGNYWKSCAPSSAEVTGCDVQPASYVDVAYTLAASPGAGTPITASNCLQGP